MTDHERLIEDETSAKVQPLSRNIVSRRNYSIKRHSRTLHASAPPMGYDTIATRTEELGPVLN
jgi:hypothetical protein